MLNILSLKRCLFLSTLQRYNDFGKIPKIFSKNSSNCYDRAGNLRQNAKKASISVASLLTSPSPSHKWRYRSFKRQERVRSSAGSLSFFWEAGLGILPVGLLAGPKPSLAYTTRCAQGRQNCRCHRCDDLHNPLKSFFLRHTL